MLELKLVDSELGELTFSTLEDVDAQEFLEAIALRDGSQPEWVPVQISVRYLTVTQWLAGHNEKSLVARDK